MIDATTSGNAYVIGLSDQLVGGLTVSLIDRVVDYYGSADDRHRATVPTDALLMALVTLIEPDPAFQTDEDLRGASERVGARTYEFLKGARGFAETMGKHPVQMICEQLRGIPAPP